MPIPSPTTPGDGQTCAGKVGRPTLSTDDLSGASLASGGGKNNVMFLKSRSGHLLSLDDENLTTRIQDSSGKSEITLRGGAMEIKQKSGDITFNAEKEFRLDTKTFEVIAGNNISFNAKTDISLTCTTYKTDSGSNTSFSADADVCFLGHAGMTITAGSEGIIAATKKCSAAAVGGNVTGTAAAKIIIYSPQDVGVSSKAALTIIGLAGVVFQSDADVTLKAGGPIIGMAGCIAIN